MPAVPYRLIVRGSYPNVDEIINVFYYVGDGTGPTATELISEFTTGVVIPWLAAVSASYFIRSAEAYALDNDSDFASVSYSASPGSRSGDALPGFVSYTFRLNRTVRTVRNGRKAFVGVSETDIDALGVPTTAQETRLLNLATALALVLPVGGGDNNYSPGVLHTVINGVAQTPPGTVLGVLSAAFVRVSSQNTRKK
jgi:hypothetical protein